MSVDIEQVHSARSLAGTMSLKQQIILQGDDSTVTYSIRGSDVAVIPSVASSVSLASGRGSTSMRVTSKPISKREWDLRNPTGHIIAVSSKGQYLAYVIRGTAPGQQRAGERNADDSGDRIRVCNRRSASKGLLSGLLGSTLDLAFSFDRDQKPLLAAVDDLGCVIVVRVIENEQQTVLSFQTVVSVFPQLPEDGNTLTLNKWRRVVWSPYVRCIDTESVPDLGSSLIVTSDNRAELWRLDVISDLAGGRQSSTEPLLLDSVTRGRYDVTEHQLPVTDAVLSCDGEHLIVGTTSLDGYVNFLQLDSVEPDGYNVTVLQHWRPHNGRPVYSLCFLDNVEEPLSTMWKYALTLSQPQPEDSGSSEIKLWHCQTWDCLQTLSFQPALQTSPSLRLQLSLSGDFAFLTDVNRAVLYLIHLELSESTATCSSLTELLLASECLDFALLKVGFKSPKGNDHGISYSNGNGNGNDDQENVQSLLLNGSLVSGNVTDPSVSFLSSAHISRGAGGGMPVTGHLIAVSPKLIHELTIKLASLPLKSSEQVLSPPAQKPLAATRNSGEGLSLSEIGRHLVTPDLLNRSLTSGAKNSPGAASTLTGVTSLHQTVTGVGMDAEEQSSRPTTASISLFPGGININSPHLGAKPSSSNGGTDISYAGQRRQGSLANSTNSVNYSPQNPPAMVIHAASADAGLVSDRSLRGEKDVVGMLFEAADRFRASQLGATDSSLDVVNIDRERLHRPSPPPSDTSLEVADILNSGRPVGGLDAGAESDVTGDDMSMLRAHQMNGPEFGGFGNQRSAAQPASATPQLLAPGALLGSLPDSSSTLNGLQSQSLPIGRTSQTMSRTPQGTAINTSGVTPTTANAEHTRQLITELSHFRETVSSLSEDQRRILQVLSGLSERINSLERRDSSARFDAQSFDTVGMANQLGDIVGRQATTRIDILLSEAIADCRSQLDATGRQAVADVKTTVSQQVAERVHASMDVFRHALQGVVTSRPVVDAVASATAEAASHAVASSSREVFTSTVLPAIDRSVQSMLAQLGDTLAQGTAQYEQRLRNNLDATLTAHQQAIQQQYSNIEATMIGRIEGLIDRKFNDHMLTFEQRSAEAQKALTAAVLRSISERMETLAKQTASTVDQAVAGAVARSRPVTPAPTPVQSTSAASTADVKRQIAEFLRRAEWNSAFQTALGATDLPILIWLCQQVPVATIFRGAGPCPLTQAVLLSFIQQMAFDLTTQSELKADWLSEAIMALDVSDVLVSRNLPQIARGADTGIERYLTATASATPGAVSTGSARVAKQLRMAQTILRSLLMSVGNSSAGKS